MFLRRTLLCLTLAAAADTAGAQTEPSFPLELRPGAPKSWEDDGIFWGASADFALNPNGNIQNRIGLFHWYLPGVGGAVQVSLFHNSADSNRQRGLGFGFRVGPAAKLSVSELGVVTIEEADGTPFVFTPDDAGGYRAETFVTQILQHQNGQWILFERAGFRRIFEDPNNLGFVETARVDRTGDTLTFSYDTSNRLTRIRDSAGREAVFTIHGNLYSQIRDPLGAVFSLFYERGELTSIQGPMTNNITPRIDLNYDPLHHVIVQRTTWGGAGLSIFSYYPDRRLRTAIPDGGSPLRVDYAAGQVSVTDALQRTTILKYQNGAVIEMIAPGGMKVSTTRDERLRPVTVLDESGHLYSYAYDDGDNLIASSDEVSTLKSWVYDARHNMIEANDGLGLITRYTYSARDQVTSETNPLLETTTYEYDPAGNLIRIEDFAGVTRYSATYDHRGKALTETNETGKTWTYAYDGYGNMVSVIEPNMLLGVSQTVGPLGHVLSVTNTLGETTTYTYDELNRPLAAARADGSAIAVQMDLEGRVTNIENNAGPVPQRMSRTFAGKESVATVETNGVQLQSAPAMSGAPPLAPVEPACEPSCGLRCGEDLPDTCGGLIDCPCE